MTRVTDRIPEEIGFEPHGAQEDVVESGARFKVIAAGRRSGKTVLTAVLTVIAFLAGGSNWNGWWVAPSHDITETGFHLIEAALSDHVIANVKRSPPYAITLTSGAHLEFHSVSGSPNVSVGLDLVVIDEAAKGIPSQAWEGELRPTLSDRDGEAIMISTPDGKGWFHKWWNRGQLTDDFHPVESFRWTTYDNPHVPDDEVDAARRDMPDRLWEQEYLAEFRDDTGGVFRTDMATADYDLPEGYAPHPETDGPYRVAADLARSEDYLAVGSLDVNGRVAQLVRERDLTWPEVQDKIERVADAHGRPPIAIDATRDNKLVSDLEAAGYDVRPMQFTAGQKRDVILNLAAEIEEEGITIPADSILETELGMFEYETTKAGNIRYGAPEGFHDDTVDMLAMANNLSAGGSIPTATASFDDVTGDTDDESDEGDEDDEDHTEVPVSDLIPSAGSGTRQDRYRSGSRRGGRR
jgi:hypothetical protein